MRLHRRIVVVAGCAIAISAPRVLPAQESQDRFHHAKHERLFPECATCHRGAQTAGAPMWPEPQSCRACHDGQVRPLIAWNPEARPAGNVRFDHLAHAQRLKDKGIAATQCQDCHAHQGKDRMQVQRAVSSRCFECHAPREHLSDLSECSTCHVPLAEAQFASDEHVARFPKPFSHDDPGFALGGHAKAACPGQGTKKPGASTCAVCHAIQFCETCHVNAAQNECIASLSSDPRSLLHQAKARTPDSHRNVNFLMTHGHALQETGAQCSTCHTQSSCTVCHAATPGVAASLLAEPPRPGVGAQVVRKKPPSHHPDFVKTHGAMASADPASCAACHHRSQCLDCHRSDPASGSPGYHPMGFLTRHPVAAYARETSCAECHNPGSFCQTCHETSGLTSSGRLRGAGFHDSNSSFLFGHGPSARMSLESCVSCHTESDCLTCHSEQGGRGFNPHGPDFNASVLREKAPQMCTVCHGAAIPK